MKASERDTQIYLKGKVIIIIMIIIMMRSSKSNLSIFCSYLLFLMLYYTR